MGEVEAGIVAVVFAAVAKRGSSWLKTRNRLVPWLVGEGFIGGGPNGEGLDPVTRGGTPFVPSRVSWRNGLTADICGSIGVAVD